MAEKFYQYPYGGVTRPSDSFIEEYGEIGVANSKVMFYGENPSVQSPIAVCCKIGSNYAALTVGSGFNLIERLNTTTQTANINRSLGDNIYRDSSSIQAVYINKEYETFSSIQDAVSAFIETFNVEGYRNIKYNGTGCILIGDSFLPVGSTAHAYVTPNLGGSISESGITVKRAGADVPFTYANGVITFTVT